MLAEEAGKEASRGSRRTPLRPVEQDMEMEEVVRKRWSLKGCSECRETKAPAQMCRWSQED